MPELPEAETIVRGLRRGLIGARIARVDVLHDDVLTEPALAFAERLQRRTIDAVERRGKNVVIRFDGDARLVVNLGMSGRLLHREPDDPHPPPTHPAVRCRLEGGALGGGTLVYHDVRRFGRLSVLEPEQFRAWSNRLGPEPLGRRFRARELSEALSASVSPVRSWLLDQRKIAGVGNIYANEALHRAGIHPRTPAMHVSAPAATRLHRGIRRVLREAIRRQGTTLRDYRTAGGGEGSFGSLLRVYGRAGEPCPRCHSPVERIVFGDRSAFFCPSCQPEAAPGRAFPDR